MSLLIHMVPFHQIILIYFSQTVIVFSNNVLCLYFVPFRRTTLARWRAAHLDNKKVRGHYIIDCNRFLFKFFGLFIWLTDGVASPFLHLSLNSYSPVTLSSHMFSVTSVHFHAFPLVHCTHLYIHIVVLN